MSPGSRLVVWPFDLASDESRRLAAALEAGWEPDPIGEWEAGRLLMTGLDDDQRALADRIEGGEFG